MDPESVRRQLFQLTSLSVFCTQLSYHLEEDTISHTQAHTCIMTLGDFNLVLFWGFFPLVFTATLLLLDLLEIHNDCSVGGCVYLT